MTSFGLMVQRLPSMGARVLVLSKVAGVHLGDGWFGPSNVEALFEAVRVPAPGNTSQELSRLRAAGHVRKRNARPSWTLTPEGDARCMELAGEIDMRALDASISVEAGGAATVFGDAVHAVVPPVLAPAKWARPIAQMLEEHEFDNNVFCMTRFPRSGRTDPVAAVIPAVRDALKRHGLVLHLASDRVLDEDLYGNVAAHMWACRFGIVLLEDRLKRGLNHNMLIEVGAMMAIGRRCALLRDRTVSAAVGEANPMPTDLVGQIYKSVDFDDLDGIGATAHLWAANDLGLGRCQSCPSE
jgi:hypothetical protein